MYLIIWTCICGDVLASQCIPAGIQHLIYKGRYFLCPSTRAKLFLPWEQQNCTEQNGGRWWGKCTNERKVRLPVKVAEGSLEEISLFHKGKLDRRRVCLKPFYIVLNVCCGFCFTKFKDLLYVLIKLSSRFVKLFWCALGPSIKTIGADRPSFKLWDLSQTLSRHIGNFIP